MRGEKGSSLEVKRLVHELQVRRAELEMQNEELRRVQVELEQSRANFYDLYHFAPVAFLTLNERGQILEANLAASELLQKERRDLDRIHFQPFIEPAGQDAFREFLDRIRSTVTSQSREFFLCPKNRPLRRVHVLGDISEGENRVIRLALIDITALNQAQDDLLKLNRELELRVRQRTEEAEEKSAKLRDLAMAVSGSAALERKRLAQLLHDQVQQLMVAAKICADRILKISSSGPAPRRETLGLAEDLRELINETIDACRSLAVELYPPVLKEAGLWAALEWLSRWVEAKFAVKLDMKRRWYFSGGADADIFLFEAARECVLNAVKHAGSAEPIQIHLSHEDGEAVLVVIDRGAGFDPSTLQVGTRGDFGLFNLRERARLFGGKMDIESEPGKGTRIRLVIPYFEPEKKVSPKTPVAHKSPSEGGGKSSRIRILAVDDHQMFREGLIHILNLDPRMELIGQAESGQQAVDMAPALNPDVILMDVNMPGMNGIEATREIRSSPSASRYRIIGLSFHDEEEIKNAMIDAGADAYVNKASAAQELLTTIHSLYSVSSNPG